MLVFLTRPHSVKMTANPISDYLAQFLLGIPNLVKIILARFSVELLNNGFDRKTRYLHMFFETLGKVLQRKGRIIQFKLSCHKTALVYLFFYICER